MEVSGARFDRVLKPFAEVANSKSTDGAKTLYGANYPRLQEIKSRYDPGMMFRSWYPIRPSDC